MGIEIINSVLENKKHIINPLRELLQENDIGIFDSSRPGALSPGKWLMRGESNKRRLLDVSQRFFQPQPGEGGTHGVFLGDCLESLMYPDAGVYYVFDSEIVSTRWLPIPSQSYLNQIASIGQELNLNVNMVVDGMKAETILYKQYPIYQRTRGIATLPCELALDKAHKILLTDGFLSGDELNSLPDNLREKMSIFKPLGR